MNKYQTELITYAKGLGGSEYLVQWIEKRIPDDAELQQLEHVVDYLITEKGHKKLLSATYIQTLEETVKWNKRLTQKPVNYITETAEDIETVLDFHDGFKIVKLKSKQAYEREGNLMHHCVASYFGRSVEIYSLRDSANQPHCTIEKDQQIKGKGNGEIHPKYIDYIVRYLEFSGMKVRDSEMLNLGYAVPDFYSCVTNNLYKNKYLRTTEKVTYPADTVVCTDINSIEQVSENISYILFKGSIDVREGATLTVPKLTEVSGSIDVGEGATLTVPKLTEVSGSIYVNRSVTLTVPKLTEVSGSIYVREGATLTVPKLTNSNYIYVREGATLTVPKLTNSGSIYVNRGATLTVPKLTNSSSIYVREGATLTAPKLTNSGPIDVGEGATLTVPKLTEVSGSIYVNRSVTLTVPKLTEVSGPIDVGEGATLTVPKLTEVSGPIDVGEGATLTVPKLQRKIIGV